MGGIRTSRHDAFIGPMDVGLDWRERFRHRRNGEDAKSVTEQSASLDLRISNGRASASSGSGGRPGLTGRAHLCRSESRWCSTCTTSAGVHPDRAGRRDPQLTIVPSPGTTGARGSWYYRCTSGAAAVVGTDAGAASTRGESHGVPDGQAQRRAAPGRAGMAGMSPRTSSASAPSVPSSLAMTEEPRTQRRDDSAWPRGTTPVSLVIGVISLLVGLSMAGNAEAPLLPFLVLVLGTGIGATLIVVGIRSWLAGGPVPLVLALISGACAVVAIVLIIANDGPAGPALLCGLVGGLMFANVWAIRTAGRR